MTFVTDIDKAVEALQTHIKALKVKAESNIPSPAKLNKLTYPTICNKTSQSAFKIGSSYYERDPETIEQVDSKLQLLKAEVEQNKANLEEESKTNDPLIENNQAIHTKVKQIMKDLGIPNNWSRSYYKTANSRKQTTETNAAGYLGDLTRNIPVSDDRVNYASRIDSQWKALVSYAEKLKSDIRSKQAEIDKAEKKKKEVVAKARLQLKYGLDEYSDWYDVLDALDKKDKYFMLARAGEETRGNWLEGFGKVENALNSFIVLTEEDKEIYQEYEEILSQHAEGDCEDGRVFRDCEFNYSVLFGKVDPELMKDYETLQEYYDVYE